MSHLGKAIRLHRLLNKQSGKLLGITIDHPVARGLFQGLVPIRETIQKIVEAQPDSLTMHKGIAQNCFAPHAGQVALILKLSSFSPYQPTYDTVVSDVEEGVRLGADAVSMGLILCGDHQPEQLRALGKMTKDAESCGMPVVAHIYPKGEAVAKDKQTYWENLRYCVRAGAELGVDLIKTSYSGDPESFAKVVEGCPTRVVVAGGDHCKTAKEFLSMTRDIMDAGAAGVTYGRFVWEYAEPQKLIKALAAVIHSNATAEEAMRLL